MTYCHLQQHRWTWSILYSVKITQTNYVCFDMYVEPKKNFLNKYSITKQMHSYREGRRK